MHDGYLQMNCKVLKKLETTINFYEATLQGTDLLNYVISLDKLEHF